MAEIRYLSLADVLALHQAMMEKFGVDPAPLREEGLLESAIMRPRMAAHYEEVDLIRQATLLAVGVSQAQAFLDGNKRAAFAACDVFLRLNGIIIAGDPIELALQLEAVAERTGNLEAATDLFESWLRVHIRSRE
ncbi:MAG TPA: type II toxin-antitoxin system death-on-curing family toxin [Ktedonobacteraceae bacterium]|nr:type II toxin-antitoxin system death-on-curing family toxin [Ktedonobacteraceae bacterium]